MLSKYLTLRIRFIDGPIIYITTMPIKIFPTIDTIITYKGINSNFNIPYGIDALSSVIGNIDKIKILK